MTSPDSADTGAPAQAADGTTTGSRTVTEFLKDVGLFFAAPFITLAYLVTFPFIGVMLLVRSGHLSRHRR